MFEYLLTVDRDVAVAAIYRALIRLFEAKGGSRVRVGIPDQLSTKARAKTEIELLCTRIIVDITTAEKQDLAAVPPEGVRKYTAALSKVAGSRYTAEQDVRSEAIRFLKEIDPANAEYGLAIH